MFRRQVLAATVAGVAGLAGCAGLTESTEGSGGSGGSGGNEGSGDTATPRATATPTETATPTATTTTGSDASTPDPTTTPDPTPDITVHIDTEGQWRATLTYGGSDDIVRGDGDRTINVPDDIDSLRVEVTKLESTEARLHAAIHVGETVAREASSAEALGSVELSASFE